MPTAPVTREDAAGLDAADPLGGSREAFCVPDGTIYLDGNSLGPPPRTVIPRLVELMDLEWGGDLVRSWTAHDWIDLPERVASALAPLLGVSPDEVVVADSTSVNLFKLLAAAVQLRPGRKVILSEKENFGTDLYVAQGLAELLGGEVSVRVVERSELMMALDDDVAVLMLTHVDFRTGALHDMAEVTGAAQKAGALVLWDLAHSAGALPLDLARDGVDLAVGCGYKYLNGGPGAPAFAFVAKRHHQALNSPLWGWMGHDSPFDFEPDYLPAEGVKRLRVGTPPILSLAALECGVESIAELGIDRLRAKSIGLSELFIELVENDLGDYGFEIVSPREPERRGSHVSLRHNEGYAIVQALIAEGVIGDFRAPDILRFGFAPAYLRYVDVFDAFRTLVGIMGDSTWDRPEFRMRAKVT